MRGFAGIKTSIHSYLRETGSGVSLRRGDTTTRINKSRHGGRSAKLDGSSSGGSCRCCSTTRGQQTSTQHGRQRTHDASTSCYAQRRGLLALAPRFVRSQQQQRGHDDATAGSPGFSRSVPPLPRPRLARPTLPYTTQGGYIYSMLERA